MNKTKYEIELPTPPDGWEIDGYGKPKIEGLCLIRGEWIVSHSGIIDAFAHYVLARRKRTLADWANEQPLFKALAGIPWDNESPVFLDPGSRPVMGWWLYHGDLKEDSAPLAHLGVPPNGLSGKLTLENGKWKDVQ